MAITLRDSLVRQRVDIISSIRCTLKSPVVRLPGCATVSFVKYCRQELEGTPFFDVVETSLKALEGINQSTKDYERHIKKTAAEHYPQTKLLEQVPGVGPITSLSFGSGARRFPALRRPKRRGCLLRISAPA